MTTILAAGETFKLLHGDALSLLKTLPDDSVQSMTTSPPYYLLRAYGTALQVWDYPLLQCRTCRLIVKQHEVEETEGCVGRPVSELRHGEGAEGTPLRPVCGSGQAQSPGLHHGAQARDGTHPGPVSPSTRVGAREAARNSAVPTLPAVLSGSLKAHDWAPYSCSHEWGEEIPGDSRGGSGPSSKEKRAGDKDTTYGRNAPRGFFCKKCPAWKGELGLEPTPDMFIEHLVMVFREARRVLRKDGTLFLNIADTYASVAFDPWGVKQKDLLGIPHRLVHALQADGWYWRSDGVWSKAGGNCPRCHYRLEKGSTKPEPVKDRFVRAHEAMFMLTKSKTYFFDDEAVKDASSIAKRRDVFHIPSQSFRGSHYATMPLALAEIGVLAGTSEKGACAKCGSPYKRVTQKGEPLLDEQKKAGGDANGEYHGRGQKNYEEHGAQDPSELKRRILNGMRKVETLGWKPTCRCTDAGVVPCVVLDMFSGAATTGVAALKHGRRYIGLELIASNNTEIAEPRLLATLEARKQTTEIELLPLESAIYHGKAEILLHRVPPKSVHLILTDPPFNISRDNNFHTMGRTGINFAWDGDFDQEEWLAPAVRTLVPGGSIIIWNDWKNLGHIADALKNLGLDVKRDIVWEKRNPFPRNRDRSYVQTREYALWAVMPGAKWTFNRRPTKGYETGVFSYPVQRSWHPTKKPDGLFQELIEIHTNPGDLVLDPFSGAGTTACAAERTGRNHISFELDEQYFLKSKKALAQLRSSKT